MTDRAPIESDVEAREEQLDEEQLRQLRAVDTAEAQRQLVYLELYLRRREVFDRPNVQRVTLGPGNQVNPEYTLTGDPRDLYNGVAIFNPTSATLSVGFAAGAGLLAPITVPPFSFVATPARFADLSIALLNPVDQATTFASPVTVALLRTPPAAGAGPYGGNITQQPVVSLAGASALANGAALDNGVPRAQHTLVVVTSAGVTGGVVALQGSQDGINYATLGSVTTNAAAAVFTVSNAAAMRYIRAAVTTAITGGTVNATVASV